MRIGVPALCVWSVLASPTAAGTLVSNPLSHPNGFQTVECHVVNAGKKDLTVLRFFIDDVNTSTGYGSATSGPCTGSGPWTVPPGRGCTRSLIVVAACDQPNACFCLVEFAGSAKNVRGQLLGTVNGSTVQVGAELE